VYISNKNNINIVDTIKFLRLIVINDFLRDRIPKITVGTTESNDATINAGMPIETATINIVTAPDPSAATIPSANPIKIE
jgi:hypothetical protein